MLVMQRSTFTPRMLHPQIQKNWKGGISMLLILDGVEDHIVPHLSRKKTALEMWMALESLYQSKNENRKMVLQERTRSTKMEKGEGFMCNVPFLNFIK